MKKRILAVAVCALFATAQVNAQSSTEDYGVKVEANMSRTQLWVHMIYKSISHKM